MSGNTHTSTGSQPETLLISFRPELQPFIINSRVPEQQPRSASQIAELQSQVGELTLALAETNARLQDVMAYASILEEGGSTSVSHEVSDEMQTTSESAGLDMISSEKPAEPEDPDPAIPVAKPGREKARQEANERYEKAILFLLRQPEATLRNPNAGGVIRQHLGCTSGDWSNAVSRLGREMGIVEQEMASPRRTRAISLNIEKLLENIEKPFVTPAVLEELRSHADDRPPAMQEGQEVHVNGNGNGNGHNNGQNHQISSRVRKMLEKEPEPASGYRREPEPPSFLDHRRPAQGTRRRQRPRKERTSPK